MPESEQYKIEITPEVKNVEKLHTLNNPVISPIMVNNNVIPGSQNHAIRYVTNIRNRFKDNLETYRSFLRILHNYQKEPRGIKEVLENVSLLFRDHPDLLEEFVFFLPKSVREKEKERLTETGTATTQRLQREQLNTQEDEEIQRNDDSAEWRQKLFSQKREDVDLVKQLLQSEVGFSPSNASKYAELLVIDHKIGSVKVFHRKVGARVSYYSSKLNLDEEGVDLLDKYFQRMNLNSTP